MQRILIASAETDFARGLAAALKRAGYPEPAVTGDMSRALEILRRGRVTDMIVDLELQTGDGLALIAAIAAEGFRVRVLVVTALYSSVIDRSLQEQGVACALRKPVSVETVCRALDLLPAVYPCLSADPDSAVRRMLIGLHVPPKLDGMLYLFVGARGVMLDPDEPLRITKDLYPKIARQMGVRPAAVESGMRYALARAWEADNDGAWRRFCAETGASEARPSTSDFLRMAAIGLRKHPDGGFV